MKQKIKDSRYLRFPVYAWLVVLIALLGLLDSMYLAISHYRVYVDIGYKSFCAVSRAINCDTVSQSPYSIFLKLPVPVWGVTGYLFLLLCMPFALSRAAAKKRVWTFLQAMASVFCIYSIILALISTYLIHSYCIMCIASYAVNLLLLYYFWIIRKRFDAGGFLKGLWLDILFLVKVRRKAVIAVFVPFFAAVGFVWYSYPHYWEFNPPELTKEIPTGITEDMHPWIGAENPRLIINEFTDYQCFQCKKMHFYLRQLIAEYPDRIRLVHYHYPMDSRFNPIVKTPFHEGSGKLALIACHALLQHNFWKTNDVLFGLDIKNGGINTKTLAKETGLDNGQLVYLIRNLNNRSDKYINYLRLMLQSDIRKGMKLGVTGTPGYLINDKLYLGVIPPDILKEAIE